MLNRRWPWLLLLIVLALAYYGSYVRYGIGFRDDGSTVALYAKRLLEGERPFIDVVLGYNVLWFYPVVGLFKLFGVNFVLLRGYCFALSTLTAVLAFLAVERVSRRPWLAFLIALLPVLVPGMTFKNYMPLLAVSNTLCLLMFVLGRRPRRADALAPTGAELTGDHSGAASWMWLLIGAVVLGLTFLIRVDVGTFFLLIWVGAEVLLALRPRVAPLARMALLIGGPVATIALGTLVHFPVYLDAAHRGFARPFMAQYEEWPHTLVTSLHQRFDRSPAAGSSSASSPSSASTSSSSASSSAPSANGATSPAETPEAAPVVPAAPVAQKPVNWNTEGLRPKTLADLRTVKDAKARALILLRYAPLLTVLPMILWALLTALRGWRRDDPTAVEHGIAALVALGGALTVFPQYFFFRSDAPHISEFSPGFWVGAFGAWLLLTCSGPRQLSTVGRVVGGFLLVALLAHAGLFLYRMLPDRYTGTIAVRENRKMLFHGANGVNVYVTKKEYDGLQQLVALVNAHTVDPKKDYLVAYPYHPAINLLCDRRSYEREVYVDNATSGPHWDAKAIARIEQYQPQVIVLSDWDINGTEGSRFSVWAEPTKTWIQTHYLFQTKLLEFEVYTRPEKEDADKHE